MAIRKATPLNRYLRILLCGIQGTGKTLTALKIANGLAKKKIGVIDTEKGTSELYADAYKFDIITLDNHSPQSYINAIEEFQKANEYDFLIIDSLSHSWVGTGGVLEIVDKLSASQTMNKYTAWNKGTPENNKLIAKILDAASATPKPVHGVNVGGIHIISTSRMKQSYVEEVNDKGKKVIRKIGLEPVLRSDSEYEFDIVGELDLVNTLTITKVRGEGIEHGMTYMKPDANLIEDIKAWMKSTTLTAEPAKIAKPKPQAKPVAEPAEQKTEQATAEPEQESGTMLVPDDVIPDKYVKEIWEKAKKKGWSSTHLKRLLSEKYQREGLRALTMKEAEQVYNDICDDTVFEEYCGLPL